LHARGDLLAGHAAQRVDHLADADVDPRHVDRARMRERGGRRLVPDQQVADDGARRLHPHPRRRRDGTRASTPDSGSRMMPLANDDAALLGLPGRTVIVGRRSERPSMKPLRVMS
jgi:hypothetical protein